MTASFPPPMREMVPKPADTPAGDDHQEQAVRLKVYLLDLWSFIPYYMAALCLSLRAASVDAQLGSARYHLDRDYFRKVGIAPDRFLFDLGGAIPFSSLRRIVKTIEYLTNLCLLAARFTVSPPDILHVQFLPFLDRGFRLELWFLKWIRMRGVRVVYTVHNLSDRDSRENLKDLYREAYSLTSALICHGQESREQLEKIYGVEPRKLHVIPHGPLFQQKPKETPCEAREKLGLQTDGPLVLCLGVISKYKGIPFLIEAWKRYVGQEGRGRLLIAGAGDAQLLEEIARKVKEDGVAESVDLWLRYIPVEQLPLLYQAADIHVYPYKAATTSGALLSGMNYEKAIVATRLPFFEELLAPGENALLVPYGDIEALSSALRTLILDTETRERLQRGVAAMNEKRDSWDAIAQATKRCYESLVGR